MKIPEIGIEMKKYRKKHGYTQAYLARRLNVTSQAISNYETGKSMPNMAVIIRFAAMTDTSIPELIFFEKIKHKYNKNNKNLLKEPTFIALLECFEKISYKKFIEMSDIQRSAIIEERIASAREKAKNSPFFK